jgi:hypothetical protein
MSDDEITSRFLGRTSERHSSVRGYDLRQEVEGAAQAEEQNARGGVDDLVKQVEQNPAAGIVVLMGLKMHLDAEEAKTGRVYRAGDADPENITFAEEMAGTKDEREMRQLPGCSMTSTAAARCSSPPSSPPSSPRTCPKYKCSAHGLTPGPVPAMSLYRCATSATTCASRSRLVGGVLSGRSESRHAVDRQGIRRHSLACRTAGGD